MAYLPESLFNDWLDSETVTAYEYKRERELLRVAVNDTWDRFIYEGSEFQELKEQIEQLITDLENISFKEDERKLNELQRIANENNRIQAEIDRQSAEFVREQQEQQRQQTSEDAVYLVEESVKSLTHRGSYDPDVQYFKNNSVLYNGGSWRALKNSLGILPAEGDNWTKESEQGLQGIQGEKGEKGDQGVQGPRGLQGIQGETGPEGPMGPEGPKGDTGERGPQGLQGPKGDTGEQGPRGEKGNTGTGINPKGTLGSVDELPENASVGDAYSVLGNMWVWTDIDGWVDFGPIEGPQGPEGPRGPKGDVGPQGEQGPQGLKGDKGDQGPRGIQGETGPEGPMGPEGPKGLQGIQGEKGEKGDQGVQGPKGDKGDPGTTTWEGITDKPENLATTEDIQAINDQLGSATLQTMDKTLKGAINEVFQNGNNVKENLVDTLLSLDDSLPISHNSSWNDVIQAINDIQTGGNLNIFIQTTEPATKEGIWLKTNNGYNKVEVDPKPYVGDSWIRSDMYPNLPSGGNYKRIVVGVGTDLYIFGGSSSSSGKQAYKLDLITKTYTRLADLNDVRHDGYGVYKDGYIYLFGQSGSTSSLNRQVIRYSIADNSYTYLAERDYGGATDFALLYNDKIYYKVSNGRMLYYDIDSDTHTLLTVKPGNATIGSKGALIGGYIYIFGAGSTSSARLQCYKYNIMNDEYESLNDMPSSLTPQSMAIGRYGSDVFLVHQLNMFLYNPITDTYSNVTEEYPYPEGVDAGSVSNPSFDTIDEKLFLVGSSFSNASDRVIAFAFKSKQYDDKTVVVERSYEKQGNYFTELVTASKGMEGDYATRTVTPFDDVYLFHDGDLKSLESYYGDGTKWIKFKEGL